MMTAAALLAQNPTPTPAEIVTAMDNNYCRCGTYARIRQAVARAAELQSESSSMSSISRSKFWISREMVQARIGAGSGILFAAVLIAFVLVSRGLRRG